MSRLVRSLVGKSKSFNYNNHIYNRWTLDQPLLSITALRAKFNSLSLHLPIIELPSIQLPSIQLPLIKHETKRKQYQDKNEYEHKKNKENKQWSYMNMAYMTLGAYISIEILFYFRCKYLEYYANNISVDIVQPNISQERCVKLLDFALKYAGLYDGGYEGWLKLWFNDCDVFKDLKSENILELFHWGFFVENYKKYDEAVNDNELKWREEFVRNGLLKLQNEMNYTFPDGYNDQINDKFANKRQINSDYHSFLLYFTITMAQIWGDLLLKYYFGFKYEWKNDMKIWYKNTENNNANSSEPKNALLFLHGIGIGLGPYFYFLKELLNNNNNNNMNTFYMIEIPEITMNILHLLPWPLSNSSYITNKLPSQISDYVDTFHELDANNNYNWTIMGHSYGSMIASSMYLQMENEAETIEPRLILIDPACFCLSHPSTVSAFVTNIDDIIYNDEFMNGKINARKLFAKELMISCNLRKYFHWYDLVLYPEQLINDNNKHIVITSEKDNVLPLQLINKGIKIVNNNDLEIIHHTIDTGHGEWIWNEKYIKKIISTL